MASKDLQRVGLTFTAEGAAEFSRSLKEVNASIQENRSAFKLVKSTYDENTSATQKLKDQQKYLADQTRDYTEKVARLEEELRELESAENRDEAAIEKKKNQLNTAKTSLNNYQAGLERVTEELESVSGKLKRAGDEITEFGDKIQKAGDKMTGAGKTLTATVTAPVVGLATAAVKTASDFDSAMSQVAAISGATGDELEALRAKAREMGSSTKFSATEAADAMSYMALAGWDTSDMLEGINPILKLAAASNMDLAKASDIVTDYLTAFGLSAADAGKFVDQMAYAMSNSNTTTEALGEAYKNCAATAASMGYSVEDTTAVLMTMANAGVKGGEAGTSLNAIMTRLATDTKGCATELAEYGVAVYDAEGNMNSLSSILQGVSSVWGQLTDEQQANLAKTIAGTNQYSSLQVIMNGLSESAAESGMSFMDYSKALEQCNGTAEQMADIMQDNLGGQLTTLKSALEELAISFGEILMPVIQDIVEKIQGFVNKLNSMDESQRKTIITIGLIVAAIGPLLVIMGTVIGSVGNIITSVGSMAGFIAMHGSTIMSVMSLLGDGARALFTIIGSNPIIVIIALIIAAVVKLYTKCEWFRDGVNNVINWVVEKFTAGKDKVRDIVEAIKGFFNFSFSWPKIPMPHFSIRPSGWSIGDLLKGSIPSLGIEWYAKGGILNSPTIFGMRNGKLMAGGEKGKEAVLPIDTLRSYIREENMLNNTNLVKAFMEALLSVDLVPEVSLYLGDQDLSDVLADSVIRKISDKQRGFGRSKGR